MQSWSELLNTIKAVEGQNGDACRLLVVRELVGTAVMGSDTLVRMEFC